MEDPRVIELRSRLHLVFGVVTLVLLAGGLLLFGTAPEPEQTSAAGEDAALRAVTLHRVHAVPVVARIEVAGVLEARRSVHLFAETRGPVLEVGAEELDPVEADQMLVRIDPLQAEVAVERSVATLARSESELALARTNFERRRGLADQGVASDADLDGARNAEKVAAAVLRQAQAELRQARDDLAKKTIVAPFTGVLRSFDVERGEFVRDGQELGELLDLGAARITLGVSDREIVSVVAGGPVEARVTAYPGETFAGTILRVGAAADRLTKKFPVEVEFPNSEGRLLPGMIASVGFELGAPRPRTVIPREATLDEFGLRFVWVIDAQGDTLVARRRRVAVQELSYRPGEFEVISGLEQGERIALSGVRQLREGELVRSNGSAPR
jgi:membrane fusion protein (multidrug efflux system)